MPTILDTKTKILILYRYFVLSAWQFIVTIWRSGDSVIRERPCICRLVCESVRGSGLERNSCNYLCWETMCYYCYESEWVRCHSLEYQTSFWKSLAAPASETWYPLQGQYHHLLAVANILSHPKWHVRKIKFRDSFSLSFQFVGYASWDDWFPFSASDSYSAIFNSWIPQFVAKSVGRCIVFVSACEELVKPVV